MSDLFIEEEEDDSFSDFFSTVLLDNSAKTFLKWYLQVLGLSYEESNEPDHSNHFFLACVLLLELFATSLSGSILLETLVEVTRTVVLGSLNVRLSFVSDMTGMII